MVSLLPPNFHDASYVYQWSNSAGFSRKIKVHLTFWLRQRQTCDALRDWARGWNATIGRELIDYRLYTPVQPHYVARPICKCPDPIPPHLRCGYVRKAADAVDLNLSRVPALRVRGGQDRRRPETAAVSQGGDGSLGQAFLRFPLPDAEIERDSATGLIIDGRERFITTTVFHVFWEMLRKRPPTPNALAERVWKIVQAQCDLQAQGKTWTYEDVLEKAQYIVAKYERGELPGGRGTRSGIDPYWSIDPIPVADARKHLKGRVKDFLDNPGEPGTGRIMVIAADPGAGKTEACLNAIAERWRDRPANIEYYVSTYALAEQIRRGLKERGVPARVFHGRNYVDPETKEPWCFRQEEANSLIAAGVSPARLLCQKPVVKRGPDGLEQKVTVKCQFYDQCRYQAERRETENQCEVRIFQHAYLTHHRSKSFPDPGLVIIDEKFFEQAHVTMTLNASDLGIRGNIAVVREVNYMIQSGLHSKQGLLSYLHQHNIGPDKLESARRAQFIREAKELSFDTSERLDISPEMSREEILKKIEGYKPGLQNIRIYSALIREMRAVATDPSFKPAENPHEVGTSEWVLLEQENIRAQRAALKPVRGHSHQLWLYHHDGKDMIGFSSRKKLPRLDSVPVIIIDAQADPAILAPLFGRRKIEFHRISVERKAIVTQITDRSV
ncbi:MAG TPA: hypothetical protein VNJ09_10355, partial [Chthonomonadales bacterium]|nr:hypothetical protein [Chthonomonadales bacterium]